MLIAFCRGGHAKDDWAARLGYALIELGQISELYGDLTHCEAILSGNWQAAQIASASVRGMILGTMANTYRLRAAVLQKFAFCQPSAPALDHAQHPQEARL